MADDRPQASSGENAKETFEDKSHQALDDSTLSPDSSRARRAPPTIDLEASEVSSETRMMEGDAAPENGPHEPQPEETVAAESGADAPSAAIPPPVSSPISPWVIAPLSGAVAAALVIGVGWMLGWPPVQSPPAAPQVTAATVDGLTARVAGLESKTSKPTAPVTDPAAVARIAALEKSQTSLRDELATLRTQSQKLAGEISGAKSVTGDTAVAAVDLSAINARLDQIESAARAAASENAKPTDDGLLRRVVVASLLDLSVRQGEPFAATLNAAKSLAPDAAPLKSLDSFAANGVPTAAHLSRELLLLVPKLSPPQLVNDNEAAGSSLVDRLKAGASSLVRIERTDAVGSDRGAVVARVTAAALRNDSNEARRELKTLPAADRTAAQSWIDKADARDAALAASHQFATDAMAALAKPTQ